MKRSPATLVGMLMTRRNVTIRLISTFLAIVLVSPVGRVKAGDPQPDEARLRRHVTTLASPAFAGRRGEGGIKAAGYLVDEFKRLGLKPLFETGFQQDFKATPEGTTVGRNVGAILEGSDRAVADQWIIVSAHYDHLGVRGETLFPGADDNASGVAMMLEVARSMVESKVKPRRSVMFIGFDLEEAGLLGSRYFVEHMPVPLSKVALFLTADMIGRSLGGVCESQVFVMGSERAPGLRPWIEAASKGSPIEVGLLGADLLFIDRSDYGPFRSRKVPFLFFSTGENPCYHRPTDVAETIDYPKLEAISRMIFGIACQATNANEVPGWASVADNPFSEALAIRRVLRTLLDHRAALKIGPINVYLMGNTLKSLDAIEKRGTITPEERTGMVRAAQIVLSSLF